ncbi:MAG: hypothetical protein WAO08_26100 [Hyphomicrobiaceae bacterium]
MALDVEPEVMINDPAKRREIATEEKAVATLTTGKPIILPC